MRIEKMWNNINGDTFITATIRVGEIMSDKEVNKAIIEYADRKECDEYINKKEKRQQALYKDFKRKSQVVFNSQATILYMNGKKYVSKAYKEDFDPEKGLLMCLAKASGITYLDLKRMIKGATKQKDKHLKTNKE